MGADQPPEVPDRDLLQYDRELMAELYADRGWSRGEIADALGVSRETVRVWLLRHGLAEGASEGGDDG